MNPYPKIRGDHCSPTREDAIELWRLHGLSIVGQSSAQVKESLSIPWGVARFLRHVVNDMGLIAPPADWPTSHCIDGEWAPRATPDPAPEHVPTRLNPAPPGGLSPVELIADRKRRYNRRRSTRVDEAVVRLPVRGPFGLLLKGDPHVDDDGTDWNLLERHIELVRTIPSLYAFCVGDLQNNWVGRLARLYAHQSTTSAEAWALLEYYIDSMRGKWAGIVGGNHDHWSGDGDPLQWILKHAKMPAEGKHEVKIAFETLDGCEPIRLWGRHDFPGRSQWNKTHGQGKAALMRSYRADLYVSGHRHTWGTHSEPRDDGSVWHALQIGSYKFMDSYAEQLGFAETVGGAAMLCVCDPRRSGGGRVQVFEDVELGAQVLRLLRERYERDEG